MAMDRADWKRPDSLAPDTTLSGPSRTKALHAEIAALKEKGQELAEAVHALAAEGSEADFPYWQRASNLAADMERLASDRSTLSDSEPTRGGPENSLDERSEKGQDQ